MAVSCAWCRLSLIPPFSGSLVSSVLSSGPIVLDYISPPALVLVTGEQGDRHAPSHLGSHVASCMLGKQSVAEWPPP